MKSTADDIKKGREMKAPASEESLKLDVDLTGSDKEEQIQAVAFSFDHSERLFCVTGIKHFLKKRALQFADTTYSKMATITEAALMLSWRL